MDQQQRTPAGACQACAGTKDAAHTCGMKPADDTCTSCGHSQHKDGGCGSCECTSCVCS